MACEISGSLFAKIGDNFTSSEPVSLLSGIRVIVQTGSGPYTIPIHYTGLPDNKGADTAASDLAKDLSKLNITAVIPPQSKFLPGGKHHRLSLSARLPQQESDPAALSTVYLHFNPVFLTLNNSWISNGSIFWILKWAQFPTGGENPQLVEVETDTGIQIPPMGTGPPARISKIIQGYVVFGTLLENKEEKEDGEGKV